MTNPTANAELVDIRYYSGLALLCWNRPDDVSQMTRYEAFCLYEAQWRHVGFHQLEKIEQEFIQSLLDEFGKGVLNA